MAYFLNPEHFNNIYVFQNSGTYNTKARITLIIGITSVIKNLVDLLICVAAENVIVSDLSVTFIAYRIRFVYNHF